MLDKCFVLHWISFHSCRTADTREAAKEQNRRNDDRLICTLGRQSTCVQEEANRATPLQQPEQRKKKKKKKGEMGSERVGRLK